LTKCIPKEKGQRTNNDLQNISMKTKDRAPLTTLKTGMKSCAPKVCGISGVTLVTNLVIIHLMFN